MLPPPLVASALRRLQVVTAHLVILSAPGVDSPPLVPLSWVGLCDAGGGQGGAGGGAARARGDAGGGQGQHGAGAAQLGHVAN
jgi:hypothetical protein